MGKVGGAHLKLSQKKAWSGSPCVCVSPHSSLEPVPVLSLFGFIIRGSLIYSLILLLSLFFSDALQSHVFLSLA